MPWGILALNVSIFFTHALNQNIGPSREQLKPSKIEVKHAFSFGRNFVRDLCLCIASIDTENPHQSGTLNLLLFFFSQLFYDESLASIRSSISNCWSNFVTLVFGYAHSKSTFSASFSSGGFLFKLIYAFDLLFFSHFVRIERNRIDDDTLWNSLHKNDFNEMRVNHCICTLSTQDFVAL